MAGNPSESKGYNAGKVLQMCHVCTASFTKYSEHHEHIHSEDHHRKLQQNHRNSSRMAEHRCAVCNLVYKTLPEYLDHIRLQDHTARLTNKLDMMKVNEVKYANKRLKKPIHKQKRPTPPKKTKSAAHSGVAGDSFNTNIGNPGNRKPETRFEGKNCNHRGRGGYQQNYYPNYQPDYRPSPPLPPFGNPLINKALIDHHQQSQYSYYSQQQNMAPGMTLPPPYYHAQHFNQELYNSHQWYNGPAPDYYVCGYDNDMNNANHGTTTNNDKPDTNEEKKDEPVKDLLNTNNSKTSEITESAELKTDKPVKKKKPPDAKESPKPKPDDATGAKNLNTGTNTPNTASREPTPAKKGIKGSAKVSLTSLVSGRTSQSLKFKLDQAVKQQRKLTSSRRLKNADRSSENLSFTEELATDAELATVGESEASEVLGQLSQAPDATIEEGPLEISPAAKKQKFAATMDNTRGTVSTSDYIHHVETNLNTKKLARNSDASSKPGADKSANSNSTLKQKLPASPITKNRKRTISSETSSSDRSTKSKKKDKASKKMTTTLYLTKTPPNKPNKLSKTNTTKSNSGKVSKLSLKNLNTPKKSAASTPAPPKTQEHVQSTSVTSSTNTADRGDDTMLDLLTISEQEEIVRHELVIKRKDFELKVSQYQEIEKQLKTLETEISTLSKQENSLRDRRLNILRKAALHQGAPSSSQIADHGTETADAGVNTVLETDRRLRTSSLQSEDSHPSIRNIKPDMIQSWRDSSVEELASHPRFYCGHDDAITQIKVCDDELISSSRDKTIKQWDISTGRCIRTYRKHREAIVDFIIHNPSKKSFSVLYSISTDGQICAWDLQIAQFIRSRELFCNVECLAGSSDKIYIGCTTGYVLIAHVPNLQIPDNTKFKISESAIAAIEATSEGARKVLIVASADKNIGIYDALNGLYLRSVLHNGAFICHNLVVDTSSSLLYIALTNLHVIDYQNGQLKKCVSINDTKITDVEISQEHGSCFVITESRMICQYSLKPLKMSNILKQSEHELCVCTVHENFIYTGDTTGRIETTRIDECKIPCKIEDCQLPFSSTEGLTSHVFSAHMDLLLKLPTCPWSGCCERFDDLVKLKAHIRNHAQVLSY